MNSKLKAQVVQGQQKPKPNKSVGVGVHPYTGSGGSKRDIGLIPSKSSKRAPPHSAKTNENQAPLTGVRLTNTTRSSDPQRDLEQNKQLVATMESCLREALTDTIPKWFRTQLTSQLEMVLTNVKERLPEVLRTIDEIEEETPALDFMSRSEQLAHAFRIENMRHAAFNGLIPQVLTIPLPPGHVTVPGTTLTDITIQNFRNWDGLLSTKRKPGIFKGLDDGVIIDTSLISLDRQRLKRFIDVNYASYVKKTAQSMTVLLLWLETQGCVLPKEDFTKSLSYDFLRRYACKYFYLDLCGKAEYWLKHVCAVVQASHLDDLHIKPPPPAWLLPSESHFLGGFAYSWFEGSVHFGRNSSSSKKASALELLNAVTGLKTSQPPVPSYRLTAATADWYVKLSTSPAGYLVDSGGLTIETNSDATGRVVRPTRTQFSQFREAVRSIVRAMVPRYPPHTTSTPFPGMKSRVDSSAKDGGTFGRVMAVVALECEKLGGLLECETVELVKIKHPVTPHLVELSILVPTFVRHLFEKQSVSEVLSGLIATPVALPEPFKVRLISKSQSFAYWRSSVIQKVVHAAMQTVPNFRLTRERKLTGSDIVGVLQQNMNAPLPKGHSYVSGDYTGATDNLDPEVSNIVCDELCRVFKFDTQMSKLFRDALTGHVLREYRDVKGSPEYHDRNQNWGQLMGSPVSFPVLCIGNLAMSMVGLGRDLAGCGVVINGDDIGFTATLPDYQNWTKTTSLFGLRPSVGKNFFSENFLQINSKMFVQDSSGVWSKVACPSMGNLVVPRPVTLAEFISSCSQWQESFLDISTGSRRDELISIWLRVWSDYLGQVPKGLVNWFFPRELGGLGLERRSDHELIANEGQLRAAAYLRDTTQAASWSQAKIQFGKVVSMSTVHVDEQVVLKKLVSEGVLVKEWIPEKDDEIVIPGLPLGLALSGYSSVVVPEKREHEGKEVPFNTTRRLVVVGTESIPKRGNQRFGKARPMVKFVMQEDAVPVKEDEDLFDFRRMTAQLRKFAKGARGPMELESVQRWISEGVRKKVGFRLAVGAQIVPSHTPFRISVQTGRRIDAPRVFEGLPEGSNFIGKSPVILKKSPIFFVHDESDVNSLFEPFPTNSRYSRLRKNLGGAVPSAAL